MNGVNSMLAERERGSHEDQQQTVSGPDLAKILPRIPLLREKKKGELTQSSTPSL
jgi:hypothetical protein